MKFQHLKMYWNSRYFDAIFKKIIAITEMNILIISRIFLLVIKKILSWLSFIRITTYKFIDKDIVNWFEIISKLMHNLYIHIILKIKFWVNYFESIGLQYWLNFNYIDKYVSFNYIIYLYDNTIFNNFYVIFSNKFCDLSLSLSKVFISIMLIGNACVFLNLNLYFIHNKQIRELYSLFLCNTLKTEIEKICLIGIKSEIDLFPETIKTKYKIWKIISNADFIFRFVSLFIVYYLSNDSIQLVILYKLFFTGRSMLSKRSRNRKYGTWSNYQRWFRHVTLRFLFYYGKRISREFSRVIKQ